MKIFFHRDFKKAYATLTKPKQKKWEERLAIFVADSFDPVLNNHPLRGAYLGYRSVNIGGDLRAIYKTIGDDGYFFITLGSHAKLYE
jgi:addiction module RelE/StbE family toxin